MIILAAAIAAAFFYMTKWLLRSYCRRNAAIVEYQEAILKELKWMIDRDDVPVQVLEFVGFVAKWSASSEATGRLIFALFRPSKVSAKPSVWSLLGNASNEVHESMRTVLFSFLKLISLRSFFLGWMVFPVVLAEPQQRKVNSHSRIGFEGLVLNRLAKRVARIG